MNLSMRWSAVAFFHWRTPAEELRGAIPAGVELDLFTGSAFTSVVALLAEGPAPSSLIRTIGPAIRYIQLNRRTYVRGADGPGIWLLDTRVDRLYPQAARALGMPYTRDRLLHYDHDAGRVAVLADGIHLAGTVGEEQPKGDLDAWLVERYVNYGRLPGGRVYGVRIAHEDWRLRTISVERAASPGVAGMPYRAHMGQDVFIDIVGARLMPRPHDGDRSAA